LKLEGTAEAQLFVSGAQNSKFSPCLVLPGCTLELECTQVPARQQIGTHLLQHTSCNLLADKALDTDDTGHYFAMLSILAVRELAPSCTLHARRTYLFKRHACMPKRDSETFMAAIRTYDRRVAVFANNHNEAFGGPLAPRQRQRLSQCIMRVRWEHSSW
jgi:hypothetical protein